MTTRAAAPGVGLGTGVGEGVGVANGVGVGVGVGMGVGDGVGVTVGEGRGVGLGVGDGVGLGVGVGVGVGDGVGVGVGVGGGLTLMTAVPSRPPARAWSVTVPDAFATALTAWPSFGVTVSSFASPAAQMSQTRVTSVSALSAPPARVNARALKARASPTSSVAPAGSTSMRESGGVPNGVPSARVPGE